MSKLKFTILILLLIPGTVFAQKVKIIDAQKVAKEVYKNDNLGKDTKLREIIILGNKGKNDTLLYIVPFEESGYAIVSASRAAPPVLGRCMKGEYNPSAMPPGLLYLIDKYKYSINKFNNQKKKPTEKIEKLWDKYLNTTSGGLKSYTIGDNMIETEWSQQSGFNQNCPTGCPAGCTAVSMAQILRYWECRINPSGSVFYSGIGYQGGYANFGATTYDWLEMDPYSSDDDNAELVYHAGVSCLTHYKTDGSTSTPGRARDGLSVCLHLF